MDINDAGQVVGYLDVPGDPQIAFLWQDGEMYDLNDLLTPDQQASLKNARSINTEGEIAAMGLYGGYKGLILKPVFSSLTDLDDDCHTGVTDLLILLSEWSKIDSPADYNHDGVVDTLDLINLLSHWG